VDAVSTASMLRYTTGSQAHRSSISMRTAPIRRVRHCSFGKTPTTRLRRFPWFSVLSLRGSPCNRFSQPHTQSLRPKTFALGTSNAMHANDKRNQRSALCFS
jgi:hypothetical protein